MGSQPPIRSFPWERVPTELRDMIFDQLSAEEVDRNDYFVVACKCDERTAVPSLLIAFRGLPNSYRHALQRFNIANQALYTFFDHEVNQISLLNATELRAFKSFRINLMHALTTYLTAFHDPSRYTASGHFLSVPRVLSHFSIATNIRRLRLGIWYTSLEPGDKGYNPKEDDHPDAVRAFMTEFPFFLAHFKALEHISLELPTWCNNHLRRKRIVHGMIR
ncbi:hypothetical protein N431DRAFT_369501, partial [Stipitochalara longipes BDJ]